MLSPAGDERKINNKVLSPAGDKKKNNRKCFRPWATAAKSKENKHPSSGMRENG
ncbi:hypothetical protein HMPREF9151_02234 [Hoylesella saccharolytica F0055]|uniref:Uncharacterized protein n=1 Tax=Hoylesella saccharolytica F0055 TaxID=1127699 RepID=L1N286_9BACT|nr:hypothetical protein HMPREF9151_02234 [Hoylesella saccharolytica F0055]